MDMFKILSKFSEMDEQTKQPLNEASEKGVTKHKGKYGTSHKAGDDSHNGDDGEKKTSDTSHLQSFLGKKPEGHDSDDKKGRVHTLSNKPPKGSEDSEYDDGDEAPKKRGRPKKNLKDWIEALDGMLAETMTTQPTGGVAGGAGNAPGSGQYTVRPASNNTVQLVSPEGVVVKTENMAARSALGITAAELNKAAALKATQDAQKSAQQSQSTSSTQTVKEEELDEKWDKETKVAPSERGKYSGKSKAELLKMYNALKKSGPHKKGSPEFGKMRELQFAIRAKKEKDTWGKVSEGDLVMGGQPSPLTMANQKPVAEGKKMKIKEGTDPHEAARSLGRSHAMSGHPHSCPHNKGTMEAQCYHEGYVHALEECYGQQNEEMVEEETLLPPKRDIFRGKPDVKAVEPFKAPERVSPEPEVPSKSLRQMPGAGLAMHGDQFDDGPIVGAVRSGVKKLRGMFKEDDLEESPFSWAAKNTKTGDEFTVGGKTFTKKADEGMYEEDLDAIASDPMLESWDKQLNQLINEGLTVSTSTGQQGMPDSVSISATAEDAQKLMDLIKMSGLHGGDQTGTVASIKVSTQDSDYAGEEECADGEELSSVGTGVMAMPVGRHFSREAHDEVQEIEPYEHREVIDALDCGDEMQRITNKLIALESAEPPSAAGMMSSDATEKDRQAPKPTDIKGVMGALGKDSPAESAKSQSTGTKASGGKSDGPSGSGMMSTPAKDKAREAPEPKDPADVNKALAKDSAKEGDVEFATLKKLIMAQLPKPTTDLPKADGEQDIPVPTGDSTFGGKDQFDGASKADTGSSKAKSESSDDSESEESSDDSTPFKKKEVKEAREKCDECGGLMEDDHVCEEEAVYEGFMDTLRQFASSSSSVDYRLSKIKAAMTPQKAQQILAQYGNGANIKVKALSDTQLMELAAALSNVQGKEEVYVKYVHPELIRRNIIQRGQNSQQLEEWANSLRDGKQSKLSDEQFVADSTFMMDTISGGLNGKQVMRPHGYRNSDNPIAMKENGHESLQEWLRLSGVK